MFARKLEKPSQDVVALLEQGIWLRPRSGNRASVDHEPGEAAVGRVETDFAPTLRTLRHRDAKTYCGRDNEAYFFDHRLWGALGLLLPRGARSVLGRHWDWHRVVYAKKA